MTRSETGTNPTLRQSLQWLAGGAGEEDVTMILRGLREQVLQEDYPSPECLDPYEVEEAILGGSLSASQREHVRECLTCAAVLELAAETDLEGENEIRDEVRRIQSSEHGVLASAEASPAALAARELSGGQPDSYGEDLKPELWALLREQLHTIYDSEHWVLELLPSMAERATDDQLRETFAEHIEVTRTQINRLEEVFESLGVQAVRVISDATKQLISGAEEYFAASANDEVADAALIASAQRLEHYQIASYGNALTLARRLGHLQQAGLLEIALNEEALADRELTRISEKPIKLRASQAVPG